MNELDPTGVHRVVRDLDVGREEPEEGRRHDRTKGAHLLTLTEGYVAGPHDDS